MGTIVEPDGTEIPTACDTGEVSDGYHTFDELYQFRMLYNAALFNQLAILDYAFDTPQGTSQHFFNVHKSKRHHDGEEPFGGGWFIVMAMLPSGQISNHYPLEDWDKFRVPVQERADRWDGHTPADMMQRLEDWVNG